jgi:7-keto-8-aminopelargonate synthetase-like enzyme
LSKAFGVYGGAILGGVALREKILRTSSMFAGSTPMPPPLVAAALEALRMVRSQPRLRHRLERNVQQVKSALRQQGFPVSAAPTPILAFHPSTPAEAGALRERLLARKIFPCFIEYPGGPETGYFRFAISSEHSRDQLNNLVSALTAD